MKRYYQLRAWHEGRLTRDHWAGATREQGELYFQRFVDDAHPRGFDKVELVEITEDVIALQDEWPVRS